MNIVSLNGLMESLREGVPIGKVLISSSRKDPRVSRLKALCREHGVVVQVVPPGTIDRKAGPKNQGVFAEISPVRFCALEDVMGHVKTGLVLVLDGITDTGNMGAVIRSAVAAGVDGILLSQRNSAPMNETVLKTSAGALVKARIVQSRNLVQDIDRLKDDGFWVVGTVVESGVSMSYYDYDFSAKTVVILGGEHRGVSPLMKKHADHLIHIPHSSAVESLNVSAAAAVILFEALRRKRDSTE